MIKEFDVTIQRTDERIRDLEGWAKIEIKDYERKASNVTAYDVERYGKAVKILQYIKALD